LSFLHALFPLQLFAPRHFTLLGWPDVRAELWASAVLLGRPAAGVKVRRLPRSLTNGKRLLRWIAFRHRGSNEESERGVYRDALDRVEIVAVREISRDRDSLAERGEFEPPIPICEQSEDSLSLKPCDIETNCKALSCFLCLPT